jgi:chromosome segregation ATPase
MTDAVVRNVSLQANARVTEELVNEQAKRIEELSVMEANRNSETGSEVERLNLVIANLNNSIANLNNELSDLRKQKSDFENVKHQVQHVDTFRNELLKERDLHQQTRVEYDDKIKELNDQIEYLQLTPAKRKKIDESKAIKTVDNFTDDSTIIKDGGSF